MGKDTSLQKHLPNRLDELIQQWVEGTELAPDNPLVSPSVQKERLRLEAADTIHLLIEKVQLGVATLTQTLDQLKLENPGKFREEVLDELNKIKNHRLLDEAEIIQSSDEWISLKELYGISDAAMEMFFEAVNYLYAREKYEEAGNILFYLCNLDPAKNLYWLTLGNVEYLKKDYQRAIFAFSGAFLTHTGDPRSLLYAAFCFEELGQVDKALYMAGCAMDVVRDNPGLGLDWENEIHSYQSKLANSKK